MNLLRSFRPYSYLAAALIAAPFIVLPLAAPAQTPGTILHAPEASKLLPDAVYYAGKSATTQLRNSAGIHFPDYRPAPTASDSSAITLLSRTLATTTCFRPPQPMTITCSTPYRFRSSTAPLPAFITSVSAGTASTSTAQSSWPHSQ